MPELERLPALLIPAELLELMEALKNKTGASMSAVARDLIKESPRIVALAKERGVNLDSLEVNPWGGARANRISRPSSNLTEKAKVAFIGATNGLKITDVSFSGSSPFGFNAIFVVSDKSTYEDLEAAASKVGLQFEITRLEPIDTGIGLSIEVQIPKGWEPPTR